MSAYISLIKSDIRGIGRDALLIYMAIIPWMLVLMVRLLVPPLTDWLQTERGFNLIPYYNLIATFFYVLQLPMIFGVIIGLLMLDERDEGVLTALQVTPLTLTNYVIYRTGVAVVMALVSIIIAIPLSGLMTVSFGSLALIAVVASLIAPVLALVMVTFASNKLEGLAIMKAFGILMLGPLAAYFIKSEWQLLLGVFPTYWPARAYWVAGNADVVWGYITVGFIYHVVLILLLIRRFRIHH